MQNGETLRRRCGRAVILGALCLPLSLSSLSTGSRAFQGRTAWVFGRGGASFPAEDVDLGCAQDEDRLYGFFSTCTRPYGLSDLFDSGMIAGFHSPAQSLWTEWRILHHPLFRDDRLEVTYARRFLFRPLRLWAGPMIRRVRVRGFSSELSGGYTAAAAWDGGGAVGAGVEGRWPVAAGPGPETVILKLALRSGAVEVAVNRHVAGATGVDTRLGAQVALGGGLSILSGYRAGTDELFGGLLFIGKRMLLCVSWSQHPVLGRTFSVGIGRVWLH